MSKPKRPDPVEVHISLDRDRLVVRATHPLLLRLGPPDRSLHARLHPSDSESLPQTIHIPLPYLRYVPDATLPDASSTEHTYRLGCERARIESRDAEVTAPDSDQTCAAALNVDPDSPPYRDTGRITTPWIAARARIDDPYGPPVSLEVPDAYRKSHSS